MADDDRAHLNIRIPEELMLKLRTAQGMHGSTMTGEINQRLEKSFRREDDDRLISDTARATALAVVSCVRNVLDKVVDPHVMQDMLNAAINEAQDESNAPTQ